jgi:DNA replication protein DnaC
MQLSKIKCKICNDLGGFESLEYDETLKSTYKKWRPCECSTESNINNSFNSSHISKEFQKKNFNNFILKDRPQTVRDANYCAKEYYNHFDEIRASRKNSIAICGRPGSGKTHLLIAVSNGLIKKGIRVLYFPWVEGLNEIKDDFSLLDSRIRHMQQVEVLYIDDLFKGRKEPTEFQKEQLFAVINARYLENKPVLISSERTITEMVQIDEGIGSRLAEMCNDYTVDMIGGIELNYRLR